MQRLAATSGTLVVLFALLASCSSNTAGFSAAPAPHKPGENAVAKDAPATPVANAPATTATTQATAAIAPAPVAVKGGAETAEPKKIDHLQITPANASLEIGAVRTFTVQGVFADGQSKDVTNDTIFTVADDGVAADGGLSAQGRQFVAQAAGKTEVRAQLGELKVAAPVEVVGPGVIPDPTVALTVAGRHDKTSAPKNGSLDVAWTSKNVASCKLTAGAVVLDPNLNGKIAFRPTDAVTLKVTCANDAGVEVSDALDVAVTLPVATFTIKPDVDGADLAALPPGASVNATWTSTDAQGCKVLVNGEEKAAGANGETKIVIDTATVVRLECVDAAGNIDSKQLEAKVTHAISFPIPAGVADQVPGATVQRPLAIYFAVDITGSMSANINAIKNNVNAFIDELGRRKFAPKLGVIPFRDNVPTTANPGDVPEGRFPLSDDIDQFKAFLGGLNATGGGDAQEAALLAAEESMRALQIEETRPDALKVILVITDNPGHHGVAPHDCTIAGTQAVFATLKDEEQKLFKLFYSTSNGVPCGGFATATGQFDALLAQVLTAVPDVASRGRHIAFPFTGDELTSTFAELLTEVTPPIDLVCLDKAATIKLDNTAKFDWATSDLAGVYAQFKADKSALIGRVVNDAELAAYKAGRITADVQRCCVSKAAAEAGNFGSCLKTVDANGLFVTLP